MSDEREKLLRVMKNLEADYNSGKISAEKYSYFRSKYEDKLNSIDAKAATKRIRSMQGKPSTDNRRKQRRRPTKNKRKEEQDLVQKYIINPKKSDAKYNKSKKSSMDSGTFKLFLLLILVIGFTAGTAYGIFNLDFGSVSNSETVAIVDDTAFPEIKEVVTVTNNTSKYDNYSSTNDDYKNVETTTDNSNSYQPSDSSSSNSNNQGGSGQQSQSSSSQSGSQQGSGSGGSGSNGANGGSNG
ncbi:endoglucanase [uncultured Methanobrevibacter sp.]|uniref:endoglucanase n=1 Tax=uncultured Methanobrevibacter sp. TaxID=253161 RepID=UPI00260785D5|nr:endoglucanase [uncultured Methanobrevibacter sp.]